MRVLAWSWRVRLYAPGMTGPPDEALVAFLHGDMLMPAVAYRDLPAAVIVSEHGDGELITQVMQRLGKHRAIRGSSSRGGSRALLQMMRGRTDLIWAVTPDGPRGPRGSVHPGVLMLASKSGRKILPLGFAVSRAARMRSWDRFVVPLPFARVVCVGGPPLSVPAKLSRGTREEFATELQRRLQAAHEDAAERLASW